MAQNKLIGAVAISAALAGGGIAGALLGTPSISGAQTPSSSSSSSSVAPAAPERGRPGVGPQLGTAASARGITADELRTELESGKTIAQVAAARGVDVNTVIDAMVAGAQTDLRARITDLVNNGRPAKGDHGPGRGGPGGPGLRGGPHLDAAAAALGITADELRTQLQSGKTIAQVAGERNVDLQVVTDAVAADESAEIDQALAAGKLTQAQADEMKANASQHATDIVNGTRPAKGPGRPGR
jgi:hypothetical protein